MMTNKRMKVFLLLGVMLLSLVFSGCMPGQGIEPTETEPGENLGYVIDMSYIEDCDVAFITESLADASRPSIRGEEMVAMFDEFFVGIKITDDPVRIEEVGSNNETLFPCHIHFNCPDGTNPLTILIYEDGTVGLMHGEQRYVSIKHSVVDVELVREQFYK